MPVCRLLSAFYNLGQITIAKFQGYPLWPVKIIGEVKQASGPAKFIVFCYGSHDFQTVSTQSLHGVKVKRTDALQKATNKARLAS